MSLKLELRFSQQHRPLLRSTGGWWGFKFFWGFSQGNDCEFPPSGLWNSLIHPRKETIHSFIYLENRLAISPVLYIPSSTSRHGASQTTRIQGNDLFERKSHVVHPVLLFFSPPQACCFFTRTLLWSSLLKYLMIWDTDLSVWNLHTSTWIKVLYFVGATKPKWDIFWLVFMSQLLLDRQMERLIQVLTHPWCAPELLIIQYIVYWWLCWLEALYN